MKKLYKIIFIFLMGINSIYAFTWDECIERYDKAKQFSDNIKLSYIYLKSTRNCLVKFKDILIQEPDPEYTVEAIEDNILMLNEYIDNLIPKYSFPKNTLEVVPKYLKINSPDPIFNEEYQYFKKFKKCNGIHANNKIYTAKHCNIKDSINLHFDLSYIKINLQSTLKISKLNINETGTFKYYSMSKEGMFYNILLQERNCKFYKAKNIPIGRSYSIDYTDLTKKEEIRSTCLAIPSNSGGGVFQNGNLVAIISKTVFDKDKFLYSVVEPIVLVNYNDLD